MADKNILFLSLKDEKIQIISNAISNETARRILDYLSVKDAAESELAEVLKIPISTVHYNLQQLMETGLISSDEFHYSQKGKEVNHYRLANKFIIISPHKITGIKNRLRGVLAVILIIASMAGILQLLTNYFLKLAPYQTKEVFVAKQAAVVERAAEIAQTNAPASSSNLFAFLPQNPSIIFLIGALIALLAYLIVTKNQLVIGKKER